MVHQQRYVYVILHFWFISVLSAVYHQSHYADIVKEAAEASMCLAVNEAKKTEGYADNGEVHSRCYLLLYDGCMICQFVCTVGHHRRQTRLHRQCVPLHSSVFVWKVNKPYSLYL